MEDAGETRSPPPTFRAEQVEAKEADQKLYKLPGMEGEWTMQQLVDMELQHDPRLAHVRRKALPPEFWDARRYAMNHNRLQRNYSRRKRRGDALREEEAKRLADMDEKQQAEYQWQKEVEREAAKAAAAEQRERVAEAMQSGLRVVVDCSFSSGPAPGSSNSSGDHGAEGSIGNGAASATPAPAASNREVRSLCKQLELCAAANKRARRPVSLHFAGFTGAVQHFAVEGMHADRWPAAHGHKAPLLQLFSRNELVVLSPDAQQSLLSLDRAKVYVICGLVDRTVQKGASLRLAQQCGASAVRLPIAEHLGPLSKSKGVLNVNDVFLALLEVHAGKGWREALEAAVPQRFLVVQQPQPTGGVAAGSAVQQAAVALNAEVAAVEQQHASEADGAAAAAQPPRGAKTVAACGPQAPQLAICNAQVV